MSHYPGIIGHRGYPAAYPENTVSGLVAAAEAGADGVELDIRVSADGVPIVIHDPDLSRTAGRRGFVFEMDAEALAGVRVGEPERFGERFADERLPTLADAAAALARFPDLSVFIEIKWDTPPRHQIPDVTQAVLEASEPLAGQRIIISFEERLLQEARSLARVPVGWALRDWDRAHQERAGTLKPEYLFCDHARLPVAPQKLWQGPWQWVVYEVNDPGRASELAERGVDAVETADVEAMIWGR
ncbi:glycerophosphodiester phosphodiesterase [Ectothiorhodospiraceae bacterium WFHF3C12]|nr:glycerophosphodiester phosphodiesterase [Ectothiorhodospiraceae bacterium WFHF3C12]